MRPRLCETKTIEPWNSTWEVLDEPYDLRLDGNIERCGRLVGDQDVGFDSSAMAIITRWRMPPESWCG